MLHSAHFKGVWEARSVHAERAAASHGCLLLQRGGSDLNFERHVRAHMVIGLLLWILLCYVLL